MIAYHGKAAVKRKYLNRVRQHRKADQLIQGYGYWKDGKGCAVGCTIHGDSHIAYERELGIPRMIARLEDGIFDGLDTEEARAWPERFLEAITPGQDLSGVGDRFLHWLLVDPEDGVLRQARTQQSREAIQALGGLYARKIAGEKIEFEVWTKARSAACDAYAASVKDPDAYAADAAYAVYAAATTNAANAAFSAATAAGYASYARCDLARTKAAAKQADKLIELLKSAPMWHRPRYKTRRKPTNKSK